MGLHNICLLLQFTSGEEADIGDLARAIMMGFCQNRELLTYR